MIVHSVQQGTPAWLKLRAGIPTASCFDKIITPTGKASGQAYGYMAHLLAERILGKPIDGFQSAYMALGNEYEDSAVAAYCFERDAEVEKVGFITTDDGRVGCSPDRLILNSDGLLECKCPSIQTHVQYLMAAAGDGVDKEYRVQLQGQMWVAERNWVDIISYNADLPNVIIRVDRDDKFIAVLAEKVLAFADELERKTEEFRERGWIKPAEPEPLEQAAECFLTDDDIAWAMRDAEDRQNRADN